MRALLDLNVLLALFDEDHVNHVIARQWLVKHADSGWSSCALTENGFLRIISHPSYPNSVSIRQAFDLLDAARRPETHEFWSAEVSALDTRDRERVHGAKQLTDLYLLALAVSRGGRLVTFDHRIPLSAVRGATADHLVMIGAN